MSNIITHVFPAVENIPMPTSIRVGHLTVTVSEDLPKGNDDEQGEFDDNTCRIRLLPGQAPAVKADTLCHEIVHAIYFAFGLKKEMKEERVARQLTGPILLVARDNPELVAWLKQQLQ